MTDPIAEGVKLEDAIVILREGLRSDRPLTLKERLLIGKIIDERAALTAAGEMERELAEAREAALEEAAKVVEESDVLDQDLGSHTSGGYWYKMKITRPATKEELVSAIRALRRAARAYANKGELT